MIFLTWFGGTFIDAFFAQGLWTKRWLPAFGTGGAPPRTSVRASQAGHWMHSRHSEKDCEIIIMWNPNIAFLYISICFYISMYFWEHVKPPDLGCQSEIFWIHLRYSARMWDFPNHWHGPGPSVGCWMCIPPCLLDINSPSSGLWVYEVRTAALDDLTETWSRLNCTLGLGLYL